MRRFVLACLAVWMVVAVDGATARADAPRRVALVIANAQYVNGGPLKNPVSDASLIAAALKRAGFQSVDVETNLGTGAFNHALRAFGEQAAGADAAVVYYAGHGMEVEGSNWLLPVDVTLQAPRDLDYEAINIDKVLAATQGAKMRVVVLDACRDNPFAKTRSWSGGTRGGGQTGLAEVKADDVLMIYSAAPGEKALDGSGAYSPFAQALAKRLPEPGMEIHLLGSKVRDDVLRQTGEQQRPYVSLSISGDAFFFVGGAGSASATQASAPAAAFDVRQADLALWNSVGSSNDAAQLNAYLGQFPNGMFAGAAKAKIAAIARRPSTPASAGQAARDQADDGSYAVSRSADAASDTYLTDSSAGRTAKTGSAEGANQSGVSAARKGDYSQAMRWFQQAADQGNAQAQSNIGFLYQKGRGVSVDYGQAMHWFQLGAERGNADAQNQIGWLYQNGLGVAVDYAQALHWYQLAANQGNKAAEVNLGFLYQRGFGVQVDYGQAMRWYRQAANHGDAAAQSQIGWLYQKGLGVAVDFAQAMRWYQLAALQGAAAAQYNIGALYLKGEGVAPDAAQARAWFTKAAAQGQPRAKAWLAKNPQ